MLKPEGTNIFVKQTLFNCLNNKKKRENHNNIDIINRWADYLGNWENITRLHKKIMYDLLILKGKKY